MKRTSAVANLQSDNIALTEIKKTSFKDISKTNSASTSVNIVLNQTVISHPLARYNGLGQLMCIVCGTIIKNASLWDAHINSIRHKNNAESLRKQQQNKVKNDIVESSTTKSNEVKIASQLKLSDKHKETSDKQVSLVSYDSTDAKVTSSNHDKVTDDSATSASTTNNVKVDPNASAIPEGFFDDPQTDSKMRNIPYKEKMDEELELFTKQIQQVTNEAMHTQETVEEESDVIRNLEEINVQEEKWKRIQQFENYLEKTVYHCKEISETVKTENDHSDSSDSETEDAKDIEGDLFFWRKKKS